ncbi:MAG TPA: ArsC/Spx/MgsR family protein [Gemmatimonadaceae bacterium]|nr:ArsC/Spx/MgsR family protein [Gemmatimonadaceae bacterium]
MEVQIFGVKKSADTRKALRFFSERRVKTHFVDFTERPASLSELRRFAQRYGIDALVDRGSRSFASLGMRSASLSEERWLDKLIEEPLLLRMPLVRQVGPGAKGLTIGLAEDEWRQWTAS